MKTFSRKFFFLTFSVIIAAFLFKPQAVHAQDAVLQAEADDTEAVVESNVDIPAEEVLPTEDSSTKTKHNNVFLTGGINFMLSTGDFSVSAPSPILYSVGVGCSLRLASILYFQPRLTGWMQYYLWNNDESYAYPAEIENRTATVFSFMLDIPLVLSFEVEKNTFEAGLGLGFLPRYGILSNGVAAEELGTSGTAQGDVELINSWLWSNLRYLYPEASFAYTYSFAEDKQLGAELRFYCPIGSLTSGRGMDGMIMSLSVKAAFCF